jgi:hypothetical protein
MSRPRCLYNEVPDRVSRLTNGAVIDAEIDWFLRLLDLRYRIHAGESEGDVLALCPPPRLPDGPLPYAAGVRSAELSDAERLILILALLPYLRPQALDSLLIHNHNTARRFTEFGGTAGGAQSGFRPTRETALFLLAGESMDQRIDTLRLFQPDAPLQRYRILDLPSEPGEPGPWLPLTVSERWIARLTSGATATRAFSPAFPAQLLTTHYSLANVVLDEGVREEIDSVLGWARNEARLMEDWGLASHIKPGYRALFHGPPGTGKTMTAAVLGKELGLPVYRVDLSRVVSKWIGETEKNLGALFDHAAHGEMLLFFDEADALFGKRGDTRSANDRHANQQIAYLLQRIEESPGLVILASNLKGNIDAAFARRFQAMVHFPMPEARDRAALWRAAFATVPPSRVGTIDFEAIARDHELAGGSIMNVLRHAAIQAAARGDAISEHDLRAGIARELLKEGKQTI